MKLKSTIKALLHEEGNFYFIKEAYDLITAKKIPKYNAVKPLFKDKKGIEIGGPSSMFADSGSIPLYTVICELDGCNFSTKTLWEKSLSAGKTYQYHKKKVGNQFISEATNLNIIENESYDFLISSNCLEHIANPLQAVEEWLRVVKNEGILLLALPNKAYNFDHNRPFTKFEHLLDDYKNNVGENDMTHFDEIMELHDLSMDLPAGTPEQFRERSLRNLENRGLHHHVFNTDLLREIFDFFNIETLFTEVGVDYVIVGRKK